MYQLRFFSDLKYPRNLCIAYAILDLVKAFISLTPSSTTDYAKIMIAFPAPNVSLCTVKKGRFAQTGNWMGEIARDIFQFVDYAVDIPCQCI